MLLLFVFRYFQHLIKSKLLASLNILPQFRPLTFLVRIPLNSMLWNKLSMPLEAVVEALWLDLVTILLWGLIMLPALAKMLQQLVIGALSMIQVWSMNLIVSSLILWSIFLTKNRSKSTYPLWSFSWRSWWPMEWWHLWPEEWLHWKWSHPWLQCWIPIYPCWIIGQSLLNQFEVICFCYFGSNIVTIFSQNKNAF